jgi:phage tail sheath protein FI
LNDAAADVIAVSVTHGNTSQTTPIQRTAFSLPIGAGESRSFSFGALYHPWAFVREQPGASALVRVAPEGMVAGLIASRALRRGAWIAPANESLPDVLALAPAISSDDLLTLLDARINAIVQEPRGFVPISASTLSADEDLEPISVRRLLSLLRRLALREGATYVFEPNDEAFRRGVQRGFEAWMTRMFERGAFAGRTTATAFQVTTDTSVNTRQSVDAGRFIVELRVAPSRPMTFLTVRLVQSGDRATVTEVA